ncbi:glutathione S-transferase family protein [Sphingobium sufflavum]|uniref:glutathione S-transferase family protein n=1 Tax=Sphingobium sufflavum TaxID=1129547 RepID=UPI001F36A075|nr:glutathione S-transferase family protein [Sphingobium sufflavum]MCE7795271.1 glutathione S-transferase family protein [Sphingobium sufflavum]
MPDFYGHPFSSYSWKAQIALYEKGVDFTWHVVEQGPALDTLKALWPLAKFPVLVDETGTYIESSIIIEHVDRLAPGHGRLIPADAKAALQVRFMDRVFDNHVMAVMQQVVNEFLRPPEQRDMTRIPPVHAALDTIYGWLDANLPDADWACGADFTLADCAAAPSLFYADWVHPIPDRLPRLKAYRARLLARPSVARAVDGGRPYRPYFPLGAPDRD